MTLQSQCHQLTSDANSPSLLLTMACSFSYGSLDCGCWLLYFSYSSHIHTINQIGASQSPPLKSLTSLLGPTLWISVSDPIWGYRAGSNTICNDPRNNTSHIYTIPQNDLLKLRFHIVVNKTQFKQVYVRCETHYTPTQYTQSIKLVNHSVGEENVGLIGCY